jgi:hypothetical protein
MYLLYMDESGDPSAWSNSNFVIAGLAVHEGQVFRLGKQLDDIEARYFPSRQMPIGFHATELRAGRNPPFSLLSSRVRRQLADEIYDCIFTSSFPHLVAFATDMHVSSAESYQQAYHDTFQDFLQRFNMFLTRQFSFGLRNKGLVIMDQGHHERARELFADFKRAGTQYQGYLSNIIDIPYFAGRHDSRMIQLADFCANAVFRRYEYNDGSYFNKILPRIDRRGPQDPPDGLKHFTRQSCSCEACVWR